MTEKQPAGEKSRAKKLFQTKLLEWHKDKQRSFAWRERREPWSVLVAETLLQRTQASQVHPVYVEFMNRFPKPSLLVRASSESVAGLLSSLGLAVRADRLKAVASEIVERHDGEIPDTYDGLRGLPGVGPYVANAVLCFGFDRQVPIVDSNIIRVFQRYLGFRSSKRRARDDPVLWRRAAAMLPAAKAREFNLALLDFEASVCVPRQPLCDQCPVSNGCQYYSRPNARSTQKTPNTQAGE